MKTRYNRTISYGNYNYESAYYKCTSDEWVEGCKHEHYIGYETPCDYINNPASARGASVSEGLASVSLDAITAAYCDYKMSLEF